jgi:hypothetical protein
MVALSDPRGWGNKESPVHLDGSIGGDGEGRERAWGAKDWMRRVYETFAKCPQSVNSATTISNSESNGVRVD